MNLLIDYIKKKKWSNNMKSIRNLEINEEIIKDITEEEFKEKNDKLSNNLIKFFKTQNKDCIEKLEVFLPSDDKDFDKLYKNESKELRSENIDILKKFMSEEDIVTYRNLSIVNPGLAIYFIMTKKKFRYTPEINQKLDRVLKIYEEKIKNSQSFSKTL